eukprot:12082254-Alexandrium_andersonii.AAC.1
MVGAPPGGHHVPPWEPGLHVPVFVRVPFSCMQQPLLEGSRVGLLRQLPLASLLHAVDGVREALAVGVCEEDQAVVLVAHGSPTSGAEHAIHVDALKVAQL